MTKITENNTARRLCSNDIVSEENFVKDGTVYILGPFDDSIARKVIPDLVKLIEFKKSQRDPQIDIYINSFGGYSHQLIALLTLIQQAKKSGIKIVTYNMGVAMSCGSILAIAGDERKMYRYACNLAHLGFIGDGVSTFEQIDRTSKHWKWWFNCIVKLYLENTKCTKKQIEAILKDDNCYMTPEECLKLGICTEII